MPTGAVYQPTTVTYEQPAESRWNCPMSYFSRRLTTNFNRAVCLQFTLLGLGVVLVLTGVGLVIAGTVQDGDQAGLVAAGGILIALGIIETGLGGWCMVRRSGFGSGWTGGKDAAGGGGNAAALTALNPSTDPLVAAQYAPVRDAPPAPDDEMRNLMDNKECLSSAEESDKMLDGRPSVA